jgi:hypothetical protein
MTNQTKAMLRSWANAFAAAVITALIVVLGDGEITVSDLWYVLVAGLIAVLPVIKNYFDPNYSLYGKGDTTVEVVVPE